MATITGSLPAHRFWPLKGNIEMDSSEPLKQASKHLAAALEIANAKLEERGVTVVFLSHVPLEPTCAGIDPTRNLLLGIHSKDEKGPIDILDLKALDEKSLKPVELLGEEIVAKVDQHLLARKTAGILFTASGSKLDVRKMTEYEVTIDPQGYLLINKHRIFIEDQTPYQVLKADRLRSYTIMRFASDENGTIHLFDDYDLVRLNKRSMFIDSTATHLMAENIIAPEHQEDAKAYMGGYYGLERDTTGESERAAILKNLQEIPLP